MRKLAPGTVGYEDERRLHDALAEFNKAAAQLSWKGYAVELDVLPSTGSLATPAYPVLVAEVSPLQEMPEPTPKSTNHSVDDSE